MNYFGDDIVNIKDLKSLYRKYSKKYHPDNKLTGDTKKFIEIKQEYDNKIKQISPKIKNKKIKIELSPSDAYNGCTVKIDDNIIISIPMFYFEKYKTLKLFNNYEKIMYYITIVVKDYNNKIKIVNNIKRK